MHGQGHGQSQAHAAVDVADAPASRAPAQAHVAGVKRSRTDSANEGHETSVHAPTEGFESRKALRSSSPSQTGDARSLSSPPVGSGGSSAAALDVRCPVDFSKLPVKDASDVERAQLEQIFVMLTKTFWIPRAMQDFVEKLAYAGCTQAMRMWGIILNSSLVVRAWLNAWLNAQRQRDMHHQRIRRMPFLQAGRRCQGVGVCMAQRRCAASCPSAAAAGACVAPRE